jgi:hypothetical protein
MPGKPPVSKRRLFIRDNRGEQVIGLDKVAGYDPGFWNLLIEAFASSP